MDRRTLTAVLAVVLLAGFGLYRITEKERPNTPEPIATAPPRPIEKVQDLHVGMLTIEAGQHWRMPFTINNMAIEPKVKGRFEAAGGMKDDVNVLLMETDAYTNWTHGNDSKAIFTSGRATVGNIETPTLTPGKEYVLVVSNQHAWLVSRNVTLTLQLHYKIAIR